MKKAIFIAVCVVFVLFGCFSPWKGDEGTFTVSIGGGSSAGRGMWGIYNTDNFDHTVTVTGRLYDDGYRRDMPLP